MPELARELPPRLRHRLHQALGIWPRLFKRTEPVLPI